MDWTDVAVLAAVAGAAAVMFSVMGLVGLYAAWWADQRRRAARRARWAAELAARKPAFTPPGQAPLRVVVPPPPMVPLELSPNAIAPRMGDTGERARWAAETDTIHERRPEVRALWEIEPDHTETVQARRVDASRRGRYGGCTCRGETRPECSRLAQLVRASDC